MHFALPVKELYNKGALHIITGTLTTKFVGFFGSIFVVRLLSKEEYGLLSYVENLYSYAYIFAGLGLSNALIRFLIVAEDHLEEKRIFNYIIRRDVIINIFIAMCLCVVGVTIKLPENYSEAKILLPIAALVLPFQDLLQHGLFTIRAFFKNKLYALLAFSSSVLLIVGRVTGAIVDGVSGVLWSQVIVNGSFAVWLFSFVNKTFFLKTSVGALASKIKRDINRYSIQYMITNGFWALFMLNDTFLLAWLLNDPSGLADYKVACVLPGNISIFSTAIGTFTGPYFVKHEHDKNWIRSNYKKVYIVTAVIVGVVAGMIGLFSRPLIRLMYGEQYLNIIPLMQVLLLAAFVNSGLRFTTANLLASMGQIRYNMLISGVGLVLQVVMNLLFIPRLGVMAAAINGCLVYFMMAVTLFYIFYNMYYRSNGCEMSGMG